MGKWLIMKYSLLVISCDKNRDLFELFKTFQQKFWKLDSSIKKYVLFENEDPTSVVDDYIELFYTGNWSYRVKKSLEKIDSDIIMILLDDFIIESMVDNKLLNDICNLMYMNDIAHFTLNTLPDKKENTSDIRFAKLGSKNRYLINFQAGFWKKEYLMRILVDSESAWEAELYGSLRARQDKDKHFYCITESEFKPINYNDGWLVVQGKWNFKELERFKNEFDIELNVSNREIDYELNGWKGQKLSYRIKIKIKYYLYILKSYMINCRKGVK